MIEYPIFRNKWLGWALLLPSLLVLLVFLYYPFWQMIVTSFYRSNFVLNTRVFNGLENFAGLFSGPFAPAYRQVLVQTIILVVAVVGIGIGASMGLACYADSDVARPKNLSMRYPAFFCPFAFGRCRNFFVYV